jgi:drug/metabolite transporter (DMT)-like permease
MTRSHARSSLAWLPGFVLLSAVWGSSFALIKIAVEAGVAPALGRVRAVRPRGADAAGDMRADAHAAAPRPGYLGSGGGRRRAGQDRAVLANTVPFVLLAYGEQHVNSVLAGLLNATTP